MAVTNQEVILTFNADTGGVETATAKIGKNLEEANKATEGLNDELEDVAKSADKASDATADLAKEAKASGEALEASADAGVTGFQAVGAALAATGLFGLLTKVLEPILAAFLENKTVAGALSAVMAGLGAVINSVVKVGEKLVGVLVDAFLNPQEALASITEKVT